MGTSVERLRLGLLVGAGLLILVIAAFLGYARYRVGRTIADLPGKLGATITREANGITFSQSDGNRTIFTIHAAKEMQHNDGKYTLHGVSMVLYGKKGDRSDHISGDEFEYDTKAEVIRAVGVVHLDLQAPAPPGPVDGEARKHLAGVSESAQEAAGPGSRVIHVKTSGLVYLKKLGIAATDQGMEFAFGGFTGHAVGAEYNSDSGHLVLQSAITVSGVDRGRPVAMSATHGELDRAANLADFTDAHYSSAGETAQAQNAHLHIRTDGSVERIEGEGNVVLAKAAQGTATSDRGELSFDTANKPKTAVLTGSVHFVEDDPVQQVRGESDTANLDFNAQGHLDHALLHSHVRTSERLAEPLQGPDAKPGPWQERTFTADDLDLTLATASAHEKPLLRDAKAMGSAHLTTVATVSKTASEKFCGKQSVVLGKCSVTTTNKLSGDVIQAHLIATHGVAELSTVHGIGHTVIEQLTSAGKDQIVYGDTLDASFREVPGSNPAKAAVELATAVQQGGVAITRSLLGKNKAGASAAPDVQHATARVASYDADAGTFTLTGDVRMSETGSTLTADRVVMERDSENVTADGAIKVTYLQTSQQQTCAQKSGSAQPVHILAARAELNHDDGRATFYGRPLAGGSGSNAGLARLWQTGAAGQGGDQDQQGGSQIEAPVVVFEHEPLRLTARAEKAGAPGEVHAALAYSEKAKPSDASGKDAKRSAAKQTPEGEPMPSRQGVARITSSEMVYSDIDRQAVFTGGARLLDSHGDMRAQQATVFLTPASTGTDAASKRDSPAMNKPNHALSNAPCSTGTGSNETRPTRPDPNGAGMLAGAPGILGGDVERIVATQHVEMTQPGRRATGEQLVYTAIDQTFVLTGTAASPPKVVDAQQGTATGAVLRFHSGDDSVLNSGHGPNAKDKDATAQKVRTDATVKGTRVKQ